MNRWLYGILAVVVGGALIAGTYLLRDESTEGETGGGILSRLTADDADVSSGSASGNPETSDAGVPDGATSDAGVPPSGAAQIPSPGAPLEQVTEPPGKTIAMFSPDKMPEGTRLQVEFQPFGVGPWGPDSLVVHLVSVSVISGDVQDVSGLEGDNVIVRVEPQAASVVTQGGTFKGVLRSIPEQDVTVLSMVEAEPVNR